MKATQLREKSIDKLKEEHISLLRESFKLRMQKASMQSTKGHEMKRVRRDIARVLTIIKEKMGMDV